MAFTYDPTTSLGQVRLLISDTDATAAIFEDAEITAFLTLESSNVYLAAAQALDTISVSEALTLKVIKLMDLSTDGAAVARELRARAISLRQQTSGVDAACDWAEVAHDTFSTRELILKRGLL